MGTDCFYWAEKQIAGTWAQILLPEPSTRTDNQAILKDLFGQAEEDRFRIAPLRGLPKDLSAEVRRIHETPGTQPFQESWVSLEELLLFDWETPILQRGYLTEKAYHSWDRRSKPAETLSELANEHPAYKKAVFARQLSDLEAIKKSAGFNPYDERYILAQWQEPIHNRVPYLTEEVIPFLEKQGPPESIRLVVMFCW